MRPSPTEYPRYTFKHPSYLNDLTNDIIYRKLAPGVLDELKRTTAIVPNGRHKPQLHGRPTPDLGHPKLTEHLASVITIMKPSNGYLDLKQKLDKIHTRFGETIEMDLETLESDDGKDL